MDDAIFCPHCGHDMQGLDREQCPECGEQFDLDKLRVSKIPWMHRSQIGRIRAYWRTVWMVACRNDRFVRELNKPVSFRDSQRFRWTTIALLCFTLVLVTGVSYILLDSTSLTAGPWSRRDCVPGGRCRWRTC